MAADGALEAPDRKSEAPDAADAMPKGSAVPDADAPEALLDGAPDVPLDRALEAPPASASVLGDAPDALLDCEPVESAEDSASVPLADEEPEAPVALPVGTPEAFADEACEPWCFFVDVEVLDGIGSLARVAV